MILVAVFVFENKRHEVNAWCHSNDWRPEPHRQVKHKCFNGTIYKKQKQKQIFFLIRLTAATIEQVHWHLAYYEKKNSDWMARKRRWKMKTTSIFLHSN